MRTQFRKQRGAAAMFWKRLADEENEELIVHHIRGTITGRGPIVYWGQSHPFGWDHIDEVCRFLEKHFSCKGLMPQRYSSDEIQEHVNQGSIITQIKEKFGQLRVYSMIGNDHRTDYLDVLEDAVNVFPGLSDFLDADNIQEEAIFRGTDEECMRFEEKFSTMCDRTIMKMKDMNNEELRAMVSEP